MQIDPFQALVISGVFLAAIILLFWPRFGLITRLRHAKRTTQRVLSEDALKHLYHQEYRGRASSLESLSGALEITRDQTARLLTKLETAKLVELKGDDFALSPDGRTNALRIIRVHRLWERYFADATGLAEIEWHEQAERREHETSLEEAEALAKQMSNPLHDPHGDPIPTSSGELPPRRGKPLTDLPIGEVAQIIHLEDEPEIIYAQLVAEGLYPGMQIYTVGKSAERIKCVADGEEIKLAPVVAANVTVLALPKEQKMEVPYLSLTSLNMGESGVVVSISKACRGLQRRRLMDLGIVPGTVVTAELKSASGNPTAYNIRGAMIALRKDQAHLVHIHRQI